MAFSSFNRYSYPFNWDEFQRACQLNKEAIISRKRAIAQWKRLVSREHRRICDCPDYRLHLFPSFGDPPVSLQWVPKEVPIPRGSSSHLVGFGVGGGGLRGQKVEAQALEKIVEETVVGWEKWSLEEEELMAVEDGLQAVDDFVVAGGSAGGVPVEESTPFTRPPVIVPSGRPYPLAKKE